ncbi:PP2C family protein-serine/threonine phosphatase [Leptolyngbya sp. FACHB-261]|nr:PP2C family protein-serine/threonine phosphatase [Leptolyngbya sp. FACHB-261]
MTSVSANTEVAPQSHGIPDVSSEVTPVFALKELVAQLSREQRKTQDLLSSLGFALRSFTNLNQFLELIPLMASRVTDADGGALILFKAGQPRLERLHCTDGERCRDIRKALELATREIVSDPSAALDTLVAHHLGPEMQMFGTAILVKNIERGRLCVFSRDPNYAWTETRQKLMRLVADQTAVAIENDELTVELRKKERLDRELEIGAEIQTRLLPRTYPVIDGAALAAKCETASRVGGDYYDFIAIRDPEENAIERWGLVIGDVMGKGVPAGLIMTMTRGMLRAEALNGHSPGRVLEHLNHVIYTDLENSNRFVTLFYSEYNPATGVLVYSNAAHNPPLLWRAATGQVHRLDTPGMLIGLEAESQYPEAQVQLRAGDIVIYYTDGFTEAANASGDRFDEDNLTAAVQWACRTYSEPQAILDFLFERVHGFVGSAAAEAEARGLGSSGDDMTLIVFQVQPDQNQGQTYSPPPSVVVS